MINTMLMKCDNLCQTADLRNFIFAKILKVYTKCQHWRKRMFSFNLPGAGCLIPNAKSYLDWYVMYNLSKCKRKKNSKHRKCRGFSDLVLKWTLHYFWDIIICDRQQNWMNWFHEKNEGKVSLKLMYLWVVHQRASVKQSKFPKFSTCQRVFQKTVCCLHR